MTIRGQVGRFRLRRRLGSGAFGTVYLADDPILERQVALKIMRRDAAGGDRARTRFLREAKAAARLHHPQIVPVFDAGRDGGHYFIASAYVEGETLETEVEQGAADTRRAAQIAQRLADALHYAHRSGIVHRDVKPGNVMVDPTDDVHLMDFGLAQVRGLDERLTRDGAVLGTAAYMAPEQVDAAHGDVGPASDQYSLGVLLYELLCGQVPFSGHPAVILYNVINTDPASPRIVVPTVPRDLETICLKAMAKRPEERYEDCGQLAEDLRRWLAGETIAARRAGPVERMAKWSRRNPVVASLAGLVALLILLAAIVPVAGYGVVAQRVRQREREQGTKVDLEREIAQANQLLDGVKTQVEELAGEESRLQDQRKTLAERSQELRHESEMIRSRDPAEVLKAELRAIADTAVVKPERNWPRHSEPVRGEPVQPPAATGAVGPSNPAPGEREISPPDTIAAHVPEECAYARFASPSTLQWLLQAIANPLRYEPSQFQTQLLLPDVAGESVLADRLIAGLAVVTAAPPAGNDEVGILVQAADGAGGRLLGELIRWQRISTLIGSGVVATEQTDIIDGRDVSLIVSNDQIRVRSYHVEDGDVHLITNSRRIVEGFLRAGRGDRPISSTVGFKTAEQMLRQAPAPRALFVVPNAFWSADTTFRELGPLVGIVSQIDSAPDGRCSLSAEAAVPAAWIQWLLTKRAGGLNLVSVYRQLARHGSDTSIAHVPGDLFFLEVALTDTCRVFGGLRDGNTGYLGIAETASFDSLQKLLDSLQKTPNQQQGQLVRWLQAIISYRDQLREPEGLDAEGYGSRGQREWFDLLGAGRRRVFHGHWVAWSPNKGVLETVTPQLRMEPAARPAAIRLRVGDTQHFATPFANAASFNLFKNHLGFNPFPVLDDVTDLELHLAADEQKLLAHGKIAWRRMAKPLGQRHTQSGPKSRAASPTGWQTLSWLVQLRSYPSLKEPAERMILLTVDRLREQAVSLPEAREDEAAEIARLFCLETALLALEGTERDPQLRLVRDAKSKLLAALIKRLAGSLSGQKRWEALLASLRRVPKADQTVRERLAVELLQSTEWISELDASLESVQKLMKMAAQLDKTDADLNAVRQRIDRRLIRLIETRVRDVIQDTSLYDVEKEDQVHDLIQLLPKTEEGQEAKLRVNAMWRERP